MVVENDGNRVVNPAKERNICFKTFKNLPENTYFKVRVHYENNLVTVSIFNTITN